jgi:pimeloyl-ACP methyl ester carboxylesterase
VKLLKMNILSIVVGLMLMGCASSQKSTAPLMKSGHEEVNGIKMYYETYGDHQGVPLLLIHGGGSNISVTWSKMIPFLSADRKVIAIDEQGHGKSSDRKGPVSFEQTADDIAALLKSIGVDQVDVMGFSNGATNALQLTLRHPTKVRKLVHISSFTKRSGAAPGFFDYMKTADLSNMPIQLKQAFLKDNPDPEKLKVMHDKDADRMRSFKDISDQKIKAIKVPTLIVQGDQDVVQVKNSVELTQMIKGARLLVLPGGHGDFLGEVVMAKEENEMPKLTAGLISEFLGKP